ncbi:putative Alkaline phosphatase-like protein [Seiridium cardinale]
MDKTLDWIKQRDINKPFLLMCHRKARHHSWECDGKHKHLYQDHIRLPDTFGDDYKHRARAAKVARMRVAEDLSYFDLGLTQPEGGSRGHNTHFTFSDNGELAEFKFQRYMQRYLRTVQSIDDNVCRILDFLDEEGLAENTIVIYTSVQGFFLGEHGWLDKRFMYEEFFPDAVLHSLPKRDQVRVRV